MNSQECVAITPDGIAGVVLDGNNLRITRMPAQPQPAPDAVETALDACDNYRELLAARGFTLTVDTTTAARAAHAAELARAEAQRVALEAADVMAKDYEEWHMAYRAARAKAGA